MTAAPSGSGMPLDVGIRRTVHRISLDKQADSRPPDMSPMKVFCLNTLVSYYFYFASAAVGQC
jgi:hypothetical protein